MIPILSSSRQELVRTAMTATLDALRPTRRRKKNSVSSASLPPDIQASSALQDSLLNEFSPLSHRHRLPPDHTLPPEFSLHNAPLLRSTAQPQIHNSVSIEWIGHATMLINLAGKWILTDPVFSERVGVEVFGKIIGIDRYTSPSATLTMLPQPDIIVLSHAHLDHTDLPTLRELTSCYPEKIHVVTAKNTSDVIDDLPWKSLHELDWEQDLWLDSVKISGLQVRHNGWRLPWERDRAQGFTESGRSYNGYLMERAGKKVVFGGDTAYTPHFSLLRNHGIDIAIMPIGAYQGYETLHCTPEQALQMADAMQAEYFIPMHCMTFDQSDEDPSEPLERLLRASHRHQTTVAMKHIGEYFRL